MTDQQLEQAPAWLDLPEKESYWSCLGHDIEPKRKWFWQKTPGRVPGWRTVYYSKEDAEAYASLPSARWRWNGMPARPVSLSDSMFDARTSGDLGVRVKSYQDGKWVTVKEYPAGVPLR